MVRNLIRKIALTSSNVFVLTRKQWTLQDNKKRKKVSIMLGYHIIGNTKLLIWVPSRPL